MAATTTTENPRLAFATAAELGGVETAGLGTGDLAYVALAPTVNAPRFYFLDKASTLAVTADTVLATKDSALGALPATPGRWIRTNIVAA